MRNIISPFVIFSFNKVRANTEQHIGDKLFTTPISEIGIRLTQELLIKLPTEPYIERKVSSAWLDLGISSNKTRLLLKLRSAKTIILASTDCISKKVSTESLGFLE